jgi:adenylate kinase family enzyme/GNAT superfamily N-acetyltransferase
MKPCRIHILGASGSGVTALGRSLAGTLAVPHHDTDDYFWLPTVPPYREKRPVADRLRLMREMFLERLDWVLSGSLDGWGDEIAPRFNFVIFVSTPTPVRLARLREREARHFGVQAVGPGGWRYRETEEFIAWASHYEDGTREGRSRKRHAAWLKTLSCPVLRSDGTRPTADLVEDVLRHLPGSGAEVPKAQKSEPPIGFRSANPTDFDFCANLYFAGMEAAIRDLYLDPAVQRANFRQRWAADEVKIILRDGADVGWVQSRLEGDSAFIVQLFVAGPFQRKGIGTLVVKRIIEEAGRAAKNVTLGVVKTNPALRLYERLGFRITHEKDRKFYMRRERELGTVTE